MCAVHNNCDKLLDQKTFSALMPIIIANFVNMFLLIFVVFKFLHEINKRYGNSYKRAKYTVTAYMLLFSLSFLIRGTTDILQDTSAIPDILKSATY